MRAALGDAALCSAALRKRDALRKLVLFTMLYLHFQQELGAAGFLKGRTATTHPNAFEELREYCEQIVERRIVDAGDVITIETWDLSMRVFC